MFELIAVTNRHLCGEVLADRVRALAQAGVSGIIVREKDLDPDNYRVLAKQVMRACSETGTPCTLHTFADVATKLGCERLHLSLKDFENCPQLRDRFQVIGVSVHGADEARRAELLGADYVIAGHVFATACKEGLAPRGQKFLYTVCAGVSIPVYAIGGIAPGNIAQVRQAGARGACIMSSLMQCEDVAEYLDSLRLNT